MNEFIAEGTRVQIRTNNGGETVVTLLDDYAPARFAVRVATLYGSQFTLLVNRLTFIQPVT